MEKWKPQEMFEDNLKRSETMAHAMEEEKDLSKYGGLDQRAEVGVVPGLRHDIDREVRNIYNSEKLKQVLDYIKQIQLEK